MLARLSATLFWRGGPKRAALLSAALAATVAAGMTISAVPLGAQTAEKPAQATPAPAPPNPQPWAISCNGQGPAGAFVCVMTQGLIAKNTGQRVLTVSIGKAANGSYTATFSLPHGLNLPEGVQVWIDEGQRSKFVITTADQNGSYAPVPLDDAMLAAMKKGTILNVSVKSASGDEVIFQLSLNGFTAALAKV